MIRLMWLLAISAGLCGCAAMGPAEIAVADDATLKAKFRDALDWRTVGGGWDSKADYIHALRQRAAELNEWPDETQKAVQQGQIHMGMPSSAIFWAWGPATDIVTTQTAGGWAQTWWYNRGYEGHPDYTVISVVNGEVVSWTH